MWKPFSQRHAIDAVTFGVNFAEPAPSLVVRRATKAFEGIAFTEGFGPPQSIQGIEVNLAGDQMTPQLSSRPSGMVMFQHSAIDKDWNGVVVQKLIDQVQLGPQNFVMQTWRYRGWQETIDKYLRVMGDSLNHAIGSVAVQSIRLEYVDRFIFMGNPANAKPAEVIRSNGDFVSPKIFDLDDLWHSHVGMLHPHEHGSKLLRQVNVDCADLSGPGELAGRRSISIMTASEVRFEGIGREFSDAQAMGSVFNVLHDNVIDLFKSVVSDATLGMVGLEA